MAGSQTAPPNDSKDRDFPSSPQELFSAIFKRVREKRESYERYNFERSQEEAFATFFDLAQEYTTVESLYQISVAVPKEFLGLESRLYVINPKSSLLEKVCTAGRGLIPPEERSQHGRGLVETAVEAEDAWLFPIRGNEALEKYLPFLGQSHIMGVFEIYPKVGIGARRQFFLEKFANRIGYNLHQKMLIQQNLHHIKFINELVSDIEHNVISPNMYYKVFLFRIRKDLGAYASIGSRLQEWLGERGAEDGQIEQVRAVEEALGKTNQALEEEIEAFARHYEHTSLFLETLLRRDHFEKGTYVLRKHSCNFRTEIIEPLINRYGPQFEKREIALDSRLENVPDEQITLFVDKGLISQVFDNFFSNALKYTREIQDQFGHAVKLLSINRQIVKDSFGPEKPGIRFNFFTTGEPLRAEEAEKIFEEGFRAQGRGESGTGHGLHFVRNVVEIHGGSVGCEPQKSGNLIYFVLPMKENG